MLKYLTFQVHYKHLQNGLAKKAGFGITTNLFHSSNALKKLRKHF